MPENKLGITNEIKLARDEERMSKLKALQLFESGKLDELPVGRFEGLAAIHRFIFEDIYDFSGKIRFVNLAKGNFRFVPVLYLEAALEKIDQMPQSDVDEILEKFVEMNVAHPFREGNGRSSRIWLDAMLKKEVKQVINWSRVDKEDFLLAMECSPVRDTEIKILLKQALTTDIHNRLVFMKGLDASYYYEGYSVYRTEDLSTAEEQEVLSR